MFYDLLLSHHVISMLTDAIFKKKIACSESSSSELLVMIDSFFLDLGTSHFS
jgi:hypothetical protein